LSSRPAPLCAGDAGVFSDPGSALRAVRDDIQLEKGPSMTLSMYQASVPALVRMLTNLSAILDKAAAWAEARKIDPAVLTSARLAPDMHPLNRQIWIATDMAKGCAARLAGLEPPKYADTETSFEELKARISKTVDFLNSIDAARFEGSEDRTITLQAGPRELSFPGSAYLFGFVMPNFYFHLTTAYAILRHNGLDIGKMDFLGRP
jgi:hypothetical protein